MANQYLKLRRSSVPGKIPDTGSLDFGEIALNTYDGLAFMKMSGSNGEDIVTINTTTGSYSGSFTGQFFGNLVGTASWSEDAVHADTGSSADDFFIRGSLTGSNALFTGTITAQNLVVQTISSSIIYSSGSNIFGDELTDTQTFTGSVNITGSLTVDGPASISGSFSGSFFGDGAGITNISASSVVGLELSRISTGSITASVNVTDTAFSIVSESVSFLFVSNSGNINVNTSSQDTTFFVKGSDVTSRPVFIAQASGGLASLRVYNSGDGISSPGAIVSRGNESFGVFAMKSGSLSTTYDLTENVAVGAYSMLKTNNTAYSVAVGNGAMRNAQGVTSKITASLALGYYALQYQRGGSYNIGIGYGAIAGPNESNGNTGDRNLAIGALALFSNTSGQRNNAVGDSSMYLNSVGSFNTANGNRALRFNTSGSYNSAIGIDSLYSNTTGNNNTGIGAQAGNDITTGDRNIAIGFNSGRGITIGRANTILGSVTGLSSTLSNTIIIADGDGNVKFRIASGSGATAVLFAPLDVTGSVSATQGFSGSLFGTASWAQNFITGSVTSASYAYTASSAVSSSYTLNAVSSSWAPSSFPYSGSAQITGSLGVTGSVSITGSVGTLFNASIDTMILTGSFFTTGSIGLVGNMIVTSGGITSSLFGTASWAENAVTASFIPSSGVQGLKLNMIYTGSVTASVDVDPNSSFLIKSGSLTFVNINRLGDFTVSSDLFIVKNVTTQQPVLTVSQSIVKIATQSFDPTGTTEAGSIWFTSTAMYVGLE